MHSRAPTKGSESGESVRVETPDLELSFCLTGQAIRREVRTLSSWTLATAATSVAAHSSPAGRTGGGSILYVLSSRGTPNFQILQSHEQPMRYDANDPRAHDPVGRIKYLTELMVHDADMISSTLADHARQMATTDAACSALLHRLSVCLRDFHTNIVNAISAAPPAVREWMERNWNHVFLRQIAARDSPPSGRSSRRCARGRADCPLSEGGLNRSTQHLH